MLRLVDGARLRADALPAERSRSPRPVRERFGNRRDRQPVKFNGARVAREIRLGMGASVQRPPLGHRSVGIGFVDPCYIDIYEFMY